jgi:hypothetical protein
MQNAIVVRNPERISKNAIALESMLANFVRIAVQSSLIDVDLMVNKVGQKSMRAHTMKKTVDYKADYNSLC